MAATAAVAVLAPAFAAAAVVVPAGQATAATPSCGSTCVNIYPQEYAGQSLGAPQFTADVLRQGEKAGGPVFDVDSELWAAFQGVLP